MTGDQLGTSVSPVDPKLAPPAFNGGAMPSLLTQAPLSGSPAVDKGRPASAGGCTEVLDARGFERSAGGRCDVGAYELVECRGAPANHVGTEGDDSSSLPLLTPTTGDDVFVGRGGDDILVGDAGNDILCGDNGNDFLRGDAGNDLLVGGAGGDSLDGADGKDHLVGGKGRDHLAGGPGHDVCNGGPGKDTATGCDAKHSIP